MKSKKSNELSMALEKMKTKASLMLVAELKTSTIDESTKVNQMVGIRNSYNWMLIMQLYYSDKILGICIFSDNLDTLPLKHQTAILFSFYCKKLLGDME